MERPPGLASPSPHGLSFVRLSPSLSVSPSTSLPRAGRAARSRPDIVVRLWSVEAWGGEGDRRSLRESAGGGAREGKERGGEERPIRGRVAGETGPAMADSSPPERSTTASAPPGRGEMRARSRSAPQEGVAATPPRSCSGGGGHAGRAKTRPTAAFGSRPSPLSPTVDRLGRQTRQLRGRKGGAARPTALQAASKEG